MTFDQIAAHGQDRWLEELRQELRAGDYRPQPLLRVWIPKSNGGQRPLGIPCIRDRVVEMAALLVLGPIFEADLLRNQYGFRPGMDAKMAVRQAFWHVSDHGRSEVVDADLSDYLDASSHYTSRFFERSEEVWSNCRYLNSYAFCPSAIDVNSLELATLYTLQDRLPRDTE